MTTKTESESESESVHSIEQSMYDEGEIMASTEDQLEDSEHLLDSTAMAIGNKKKKAAAKLRQVKITTFLISVSRNFFSNN
jgi:hypothetical protein